MDPQIASLCSGRGSNIFRKSQIFLNFKFKYFLNILRYFPEPATSQLYPAPVCQHSRDTVRLYEHTCRCARGPAAVDTDTRGNTRGNCTGHATAEDTRENLAKVQWIIINIILRK